MSKEGRMYAVDFWMSGSTPHWSISSVNGSFSGEGDSRGDAVAAACAKLVELARQPWRDADKGAVYANLAQHAVLLGGKGDGYAIKLDMLYLTVTVFRNVNAIFAVEGEVEDGPDALAQRLGVYRLVEPTGSDVPAYIAD